MKALIGFFSALPLLLIAFVLIYALIKRIDVYASFVKGAKSAIPTLLRILPYLCAMMAAISVLRQSGVLDVLTAGLSRLLAPLGVPGELMPLFILKPFSGSASLSLLADIYQNYGVDSFVGLCASVLIGSSETLFYTTSLYLGSVGVTNSRYIIPVSIFCAIIGLFSSIFVSRLFY